MGNRVRWSKGVLILVCSLFLVAAPGLSRAAQAEEAVVVFAAASTTDVLTQIGRQFTERSGVPVHTSFAASSTLARQIEAGAPAQVFLSANPKWMDALETHGLIEPKSRFNLLTNRLVAIVPLGERASLTLKKGVLPPPDSLGRVCVGDPAHVPAGIYAKEALVFLGWWKALEPRLVPAADVRAALAFVERGECGLGIVYATDAEASKAVKTIGVFPEESHAPVVYPVALVHGAGPQAKAFLEFLKTPEAKAVFTRYGFSFPSR